MSSSSTSESKPDTLSALSALSLRGPLKPTPLPVDAHLRGPDNYDVWTIQLRALVGQDACRLLDGLARDNSEMDYSTWDRINEFTISSIVISCSQSVIHHVANCTRLAHAYWEALRDAFRPTDAQGALRLLTRFWGLSLTAATPEAFDLFSKDYKAALAAIKAADVKLETVFSSHLLNALPPALSAFQTSLAISNSSELPSTNRILELARNEILRILSPSSGLSVALAASSHPPPPAPCPACGKTHWLRDCPSPEGDKYRARQKRRDADRKAGRDKVKTRLAQASTPAAALATPAAQLAALLGKQDGVEVWLSSADQLPRTGGLTLDSGATHSMCGDASLFSGLRLCRPSAVGVVSGAKNGLMVTGVGTLSVKLASGRIVSIHQALLVPGIAANLLSSSQLYDNHGVTSTFSEHATLSRDGSVIATGTRLRKHLYQLDGNFIAPVAAKGATALLASGAPSKPRLTTWHCRFAHLSIRSLKLLARSDHVTGLEVATQESEATRECKTCHLSRASRLPFPRSDRQTSAVLELVHSDVLAINVPSQSGSRYVVTFVDDFSRMLWAEPLARKSDVFGAFQRFKAAAENESGKRIHRLRSDNGGEYISNEFSDFLAEHGIFRETLPPYSPRSNGVAERVNRSIVEGLISLLNQASAPKSLWAEALLAFVFVKNRSPHAALSGGVPLAVWRGRPVCVNMLRIWGCRAYHTVTNDRAKLDNKAIPLVFVGYDGDTAAYWLYDPVTHKMVRSRDARFIEDEFPFAAASPHAAANSPIAPVQDDLIILATSQAPAPSVPQPAGPQTPARAPLALPGATVRAAQTREITATPPPPPVFVRANAPSPPAPPLSESPSVEADESCDEIDFLGNDPFGATFAEVEALYSAASDDLDASAEQFSLPTSDPRNHREAMHDSDSERWRHSERDEFSSLRVEYNVFHLVDRSEVPSDAKILGSRFVYRCKKDQPGRVTGFKVRLVAQGFTQRPNVDFHETFAPVAKFTSIRVLLALAARHRLHVHQADVDKAYLHGALEEALYMRVPEGIDGSEYNGKVLKLDRALYGLKQAGRVWNHRIHATLAALGYTRTKSDACIY
ncbi:hypothetical protein JCM8202_005054, partial [Rhodotorula sphaerocarpa]